MIEKVPIFLNKRPRRNEKIYICEEEIFEEIISYHDGK